MSVKKQHWDTVFTNKQPNEVSWTQDTPQTSLDFIDSFNLPNTASIIDIGGGDSKLVDFLLEKGYSDITVLDISEIALERAKSRLGEKAAQVKWIVTDITKFKSEQHYDIWHDRAAFHFLTTPWQINKYVDIAKEIVNRYIVVASFSERGPEKCSGLVIKKYSEKSLERKLAQRFTKKKCIYEDHITPFKTIQNFMFCSFSVKNAD